MEYLQRYNILAFKTAQNSKGPFTKDVRPTPRGGVQKNRTKQDMGGEGGLRNPDVQLLFEGDSNVLSGRRGGI